MSELTQFILSGQKIPPEPAAANRLTATPKGTQSTLKGGRIRLLSLLRCDGRLQELGGLRVLVRNDLRPLLGHG